jgi:2-hydroxychromene-2-carboxylate isomerase
MSPPIRFHFDFLSPYAYIAWTQIHALAERHGRAVEPVPVVLAALLAHGQTKGPAEIPAKRVWVYKDTVRTAHLLGLPFGPPPTHPFNPLLALRAVAIAPADHQRAFIDALFAEAWGGGQGVDTAEKVQAIADRVGLDGAALVAGAQAPEAKDRLRRYTEGAIAQGVFGVPSMVVGDEVFWGYDAFGHLERFLEGKDPLDAAVTARWLARPASAVR